jgi:hypothetical protein
MNFIAFTTAKQLNNRIDHYFKLSGALPENEKKSKSSTEAAELIGTAINEPATLSGLALYLGFNSMAQFEDYEQNGEFAAAIQRARLRIQAMYERRLMQQSPTGAMFALKSFGWDERNENKNSDSNAIKTLSIQILETGFQPAGDEKEVVL